MSPRQMTPDDSVAIEIDDFKDEFTGCATGECRVSVLPILFQISQIINESEDLASALTLILGVMEDRMKIARGMVSLYDRQSETIFIHASFGLTEEQKQRGIYSLGEGITGKVVELGKAVIVPHIGSDPASLTARAAARRPWRRTARSSACRSSTARKCSARSVPNGSMPAAGCSARTSSCSATIASMVAPAVELYLMENVEKVRLENENRRLRSELKQRFHPSNIIGKSKPMLAVYDLIEKVASAKATVLVLGESGVGKELVANAIHYNSAFADGPFVKFNCAALPESIVESELFGHEKGSFTGASGLRKGRFELADGGSIFLDEVGELSLGMQAKLLRVLQEKTFERVGGNHPVKVDLRIIAATNRNLPEMVEKGLFREDLYYRLQRFPDHHPATERARQ